METETLTITNYITVIAIMVFKIPHHSEISVHLEKISASTLIIFLFFTYCTIGLLLGDGKQPTIDTVTGFFIAAILAAAYTDGTIKLNLPRRMVLLWTITLIYHISLLFFSLSIGYSISAIMRLFAAFLTFTVFHSINNELTIHRFLLSFRIYALIAISLSLLVNLVPGFVQYVPLMNLIYGYYGHNHLVNILIIALPMSLAKIKNNISLLHIVEFLILHAGIILSKSLGANILTLGFLFYQFKHFNLTNKTIWNRLIVTIVGIITIASFQQILVQNDNTLGTTIKNRYGYILQAVRSIQDNPFTGNGPGNFYIVSKRYQTEPHSFSWFAHNYAIESVSETGVVGFLLITAIIGTIYWHYGMSNKSHKKSNDTTILFSATILTLIYSFYEYNLNFFVIWLLFWAMLGLLYPKQKMHDNKLLVITVASTLSIILFFSLSVLSYTVINFNASKTAKYSGWKIIPYSETAVKQYLYTLLENNDSLHYKDLATIEIFHRHNPDINKLISQIYTDTNVHLAVNNLERVLLDNPYDSDAYRQLLQLLLTTNNLPKFGNYLSSMAVQYIPKDAGIELHKIDLTDSVYHKSYTQRLLDIIGTQLEYLPTDFAKIFYKLGLDVYDEYPQKTLQLWTIATLTTPGWSYYHVELAALYKYRFNDDQQAHAVLIRCQKYEDALIHCNDVQNSVLNPPGTLMKQIESIPLILH